MVLLNHLDGTIRSMSTVDLRAIRLSKEIAQAVYIETGFEKKFLISGDPDFQAQFEKMGRLLEEKMTDLEKVAATAEQKTMAAALKESHEKYRSFSKTGLVKNDPAARDRLLSDMERTTRKIAELADQARNEKLRASERISSRILKAIGATETAAVVLVVLISFLITRSINSPLRRLREKTKMTADGEFGQPLTISSPPEMKELAESFNVMCARLRELDQMKIDFINHLSHELRTPLTAIKEASCMLMEGVYAKFPEKQQELFDIVNGECERLIQSVSRILDLSRMEAGMAEFHFEMCDVAPIIEKTATKLEPIARRKGITLHLELPSGLPDLKIDQEKIARVMENLLGNALKFTPEGGKVSVLLSEKRANRTVEVMVSDTGCGIPEESLKEIFEKFKRVDDKKGAVRGTGLGLAISKHIINAHGGSIWAESVPGKGSTFIFSLPWSPASS